MKRCFAFLVLLVTIIIGGCKSNEEVVERNDNVEVLDDRVIRYTTTDNAKLFPYNTEPAQWGAILISNTYENGEGILTFDDTITSIGVDAFYGCETLATITIPSSVKRIEEVSFGGCSNLAEVHISDLASWCKIDFDDNPLHYAHNLFLNGELVENLVIPGEITEIKRRSFEEATCIKSATLHNSITHIGEMAFYDCSSLESINIPSSVESVGYAAFFNCEKLPIKDNVRYADTHLIGAVDRTQNNYQIKEDTRFIGENAFYGCKNVLDITIPGGVVSIGDGAFRDCQNLANINIPKSLTTIEMATFSGCKSLTRIAIPHSITSIGQDAFAGCTSLSGVDIEDLSAWCNLSLGENWANPLQLAHNLYLDGELIKNLVIPTGITAIGNSAFEGGWCFESITIPQGVETIGRYAFCSCKNITSITIPSTVESIEHGVFENCSQLSEIYCASTTPPQMLGIAFMDCAMDLTIYVPTNSVDAYKTTSGWSDYAYNIVGYNFE